MNCRIICSWIALDAGGDLSSRRKARLEKHLAACPDCRAEKRRIEKSLALARKLAHEERTPDWADSEWRKLMGRATGQEIEGSKTAGARFPGWAWAAGSALLLILIVGGTIVLRRGPSGKAVFMPAEQAVQESAAKPDKAPVSPAVPSPAPLLEAKKAEGGSLPAAPRAQESARAKEAATARPAPAQTAAQPQSQTVMAMTFVSQDTGLQIHWVFNDAFNYKEKGK